MSRNSLKSVCRLIQTVQKEVPIEQQFLQDLKRSIELNDMKNERQPSKTYKPSSMNCIRNMYYQVQGYETENESNAVLVGICESGTDRHERVQNAVSQMKDNNIDCEYIDVADYVKSRNLDYLDIVTKQGNETKLFHKELNMSFLCDGIIRYKGKYYILEIKTETIQKWYNRKSFNEKHRNQGIAYSLAFGIDNVIYLYINRDNCDMKAFMYNVSNDDREGLRQKINICNEYVVNNTIPPKPQQAIENKKFCAYCNYKKYCDKGD